MSSISVPVLVRIRLLQLRRQLAGAGVVYIAAALLVVLLAITLIYYQYTIPGHGIYVSAAIGLSVLSVHLSRKDYAFVIKQIEQPVRSVFFEYACLAGPSMAPALFTCCRFHVPLLLILFYGISLIKVTVKRRTALPGLSRIIPPADFEWLGGFRKYHALLALLLLLAMFTSPVRIAPLVVLWIIVAAITSFYQECESLQVLRANGKTARQIIHTKMARHIRLLLWLLVPVLAVNTAFNRDMFWVNAAFLVVQVIVLIFAILLKYTTYMPNADLRGNSVLLGIAVVSPVLPFLVPVPLLLGIRSYPRAISNLKRYIHD